MKKIEKNTKLYLIGIIIGGITLGITTVIADTIINSTSVAYKTTTVKAALDELYDIADFKEEVKDMLYPVGSIYISVSSTNPSQLFGGTWVSFGQGRTLLGTGLNEANNNNDTGSLNAAQFGYLNAEVLGGQYNHVLTIKEIPAHGNHLFTSYSRGKGSLLGRYLNNTTLALSNTNPNAGFMWDLYAGNEAYPAGTSVGGGEEHSIVQPYVTVFMWKRTA